MSKKIEKDIKIKPEMSHASDNALDKNGKYLIWGGRDNEGRGCIWMLDIESEEMKTLYGHMDTVSCIKVQGDTIFSGAKDKTIKTWDLTTCTCTRTFTGHEDSVCSLDVDISKDLLVTGSYDETIKFWSISSGYCQKTIQGHSDSVRAVKIFNEYLISGSFDRMIKIWKLETAEFVRNLTGHSDWVSCLCVVENVIISGAWDKTIRMWSFDGKCHIKLDESGPVSCLDTDVEKIVCAVDKMVKVWTVCTE